MNKELREENAQRYAFGLLPEDEREAFEKRVREDRQTQLLTHEYQRLLELDASPANHEPPFHAYSRIMEEIEEGESETVSKNSRRFKLIPLVTWSGWGVAACAALALGLGLFDAPSPNGGRSDIVLNNLGNPRIVAVQTPSEDGGLEDRMLELAGLAEAYWFTREGVPAGQLLEEEEAEVAELSGGFTIYDKRHNIGFIAVENLPRESPNKSYHVWARTGAGAPPLRAGALPIGNESRGLFYFDLSALPEGANLDSLSFFVTEEENDAPAGPSQTVVLSDF